ncbi:hypothetical protein ACIA71_01720 [Streptomyces anulatus]
MSATAWPYDADRDDPLTQLRIPVTGAHPDWRYTACFDRDSQARPNGLEARQLASYITEYREYFFNETYKAKLSKRPFDCDAKTVIFHKWADGDWSYRRDSWQYGPFWVPVAPRLRGGEYDYKNATGPMTLEHVMDKAHDVYPKRWTDWKADHPDVFPT